MKRCRRRTVDEEMQVAGNTWTELDWFAQSWTVDLLAPLCSSGSEED